MKFDLTPYIIFALCVSIILGFVGKEILKIMVKKIANKKFISEGDCNKCKDSTMNEIKEMRNDIKEIKETVLAIAVHTKVPLENYKGLVR